MESDGQSASFDLRLIPYEVALGVIKYVDEMVKPILRAEEKQRKRELKILEKAKKDAERQSKTKASKSKSKQSPQPSLPPHPINLDELKQSN